MRSRRVAITWGGFDVFALIYYFGQSFYAGRIPFFHDVLGFLAQAGQHGLYASLLFSSHLLLMVSLFVSAWWLIFGHRWVRYLCLIQIPFRLLLVVPSVSLIPPFVHVFGVRSMLITGALLLLSEILKLVTVIKMPNSRITMQ